MDGYVVREPRNCKICGRVFTYNGMSDICMECKAKDDKIFKTIKDYLWDHPRSSIQTLHIELGVSVAKIKQYLREERIEIVGLDSKKSFCQNCFAIIPSGNYCPQCEKEMQRKTVITTLIPDKLS
jgi:predicted amidophosphoribosyltransferase